MKKIIILFLLTFYGLSTIWSQPIEKQKSFGGYKYQQNGQKLGTRALGSLLQTNAEAYVLYQSGKSQAGIATVLGGIGGALVGWPLGTAIGGGKPNWKLAGVGAALIVVGIPISSGAAKKTNRAVDLYNSGLGTGAIPNAPPELMLYANRLGLIWRF